VGVVRVSWPILEFHTPRNISGTAEAVVKFCVAVGYIKCLPSNNQPSLKGAWSGSRDQF